jgi:hypothetical protein
MMMITTRDRQRKRIIMIPRTPSLDPQQILIRVNRNLKIRLAAVVVALQEEDEDVNTMKLRMRHE